MVNDQRIAKLTKRTVDAAIAGQRRCIIWDRDLKGFGLRVETTGVKTFLVRYRAGGGRRSPRRQMSIGRFGAITVEQARTKARGILGEVAQGEDPAGERARARRVMTVAELCAFYLREGVSTKKESTLKVDYGRIDRHIVPLLGNRQITSITRSDVEKFMTDVADGKTAKIARTKPRGKAVVRGGRGTAAALSVTHSRFGRIDLFCRPRHRALHLRQRTGDAGVRLQFGRALQPDGTGGRRGRSVARIGR